MPEEPAPELRGIDLARRALEEARAAAKASGKSVGQGRASPVRKLRAGGRRRSGWSGSARIRSRITISPVSRSASSVT